MVQREILIADDDRDLLNAQRRSFEMEGYKVVTANNGTEANDLLFNQEYRPDCVLLDNNMPGIDGGIIIARMNEKGLTRIIRTALYTAKDDKYLRQIITVDFRVGYFIKPIKRQILIDYFAPKEISDVVSGLSDNSKIL